MQEFKIEPGTCQLTGCTRPGVRAPVLEMRHKSAPKCPASAVIAMRVCEEHAACAKASDFISDEGWEQICDGFRAAGKARPTRRMTTVRFVSIEDAHKDPSKVG